MKKQKSYHWYFIISVGLLLVIFAGLILRENIFFGANRYIEQTIEKHGAAIDRIIVHCADYTPIELEGAAVKRFCKAMDSIKMRKLGRFDRLSALDGNTQYPWILGSKAFDYSPPHEGLYIYFYSANQRVFTLNMRTPEGMGIDGSSFFLKTPVFADDIFALALASKN